MVSRLLTLLLLLFSIPASGDVLEYKVVAFDRFTPAHEMETSLNQLGSKGWQLVSVERSNFNSTSGRFVCFMQRYALNAKIAASPREDRKQSP